MTVTRSQASKKQHKRAEKVSLEVLKPVDDKKMGKQKSATRITLTRIDNSDKPQKPKFPPCAFGLFLREYRKSLEKTNPSPSDHDVFLGGASKWQSMSDTEISRYISLFNEEMDIYIKLRDDYNKEQGICLQGIHQQYCEENDEEDVD